MSRQRGICKRAVATAPATLSLVAALIVLSNCSAFPSSSTGTQTPAVSLPANVMFGSVPQGVTSPTMTVTLMNTGKGSLTFTSNPGLSGANAADFAITVATCSTASPVAGGSSCTVTLTFKPSTMSLESASLNFVDNATPTMQSVALTGTGTAPAPVVLLSTPQVNFGPVAQGMTSMPMSVTVTNVGNATLIFSNNPSISGANMADFTVIGSSCSMAIQVAAGLVCKVTLTFTPSTTGMESATLNFADNATPAMQSVSLTGGATSSTNNMVTLTVDSGPVGGDLNVPFISVMVCVPGSAVNCQTIDHIEVDTGSSGLRIMSSALTLTLPQQTDNSGNPLGNCVQFADTTYAFGPVEKADIVLAGEKATSVPIQVIAPPGFASATSTTCEVNGNAQNNLNTVAALGANGIIGVGLFKQDCGQACVNAPVAGFYYSCPNNICSSTTVALTSQLQNPVALFPQDNQGVLITLPAVGVNGAATATGSLIFGIGTQANNVLGSATVLTTTATGTVTSTYNGTQFPGSFIDSGSNGFFILDTAHTGLTDCVNATNPANAPQFKGFYCPNSNNSFPFAVTNTGVNNAVAQANFSLVNIALVVNANPGFAAFSDAGGPFPGAVDFGLPFFYGRSVFTCIEGQTVGAQTGPFFAY
jgi:hypothetical protein